MGNMIRRGRGPAGAAGPGAPPPMPPRNPAAMVVPSFAAPTAGGMPGPRAGTLPPMPPGAGIQPMAPRAAAAPAGPAAGVPPMPMDPRLAMAERFGKYPGQEDPSAPAPPLAEEEGLNFNPWTGQWS